MRESCSLWQAGILGHELCMQSCLTCKEQLHALHSGATLLCHLPMQS